MRGLRVDTTGSTGFSSKEYDALHSSGRLGSGRLGGNGGLLGGSSITFALPVRLQGYLELRVLLLPQPPRVFLLSTPPPNLHTHLGPQPSLL